MQPKITFKEKAGKLLIKIVIHDQSKSLFDTGITIDPDQFSEDQQICGDPSVQSWMISTHDHLLKIFRPGMTAKSLWSAFIQSQSNSGATIQNAFDYYLSNMPLADNTKTLYGYTMKAIQKAGLQNTEISKVTPGMLRQFIAGLQISETSKFNTLNHIKTIINRYIFDHSLEIELNLNGIMKRPKYTIKENEWLTREEVDRLLNMDLDGVRAESRDLFCLCCFTGMAMSDALKFSTENVKEINDRDYLVYNRTKRGRPCQVPLVKEAKQIIESRKWPVKIAKRTFQYHVRKLGGEIGRYIKTHMGRKTAGALFLEFGFSMESVSHFLGHSNINQTQRTYTKITSNKVENEISRIALSGTVVFC